MQEFYNDGKSIIAFLILVLMVVMTIGDKIAEKLVAFILLSMIILQSDAIITWFEKNFSIK